MRVQHAKQAKKGLSTRLPSHAAAMVNIQEELERLHWRLWHGLTDAVDVTTERLITATRAFKRHTRRNRRIPEASRKL